MSEKSWRRCRCLTPGDMSSRSSRASRSRRILVPDGATMNDDSSTFDLPEYIQSRLQPQILIDFPSATKSS